MQTFKLIFSWNTRSQEVKQDAHVTLTGLEQ